MLLKKYLVMVFILISFLAYSEINLYNSKNENIGKVYQNYESITIENNNMINGYILDLSDFDEELCYLALGTIRNYNLIEDLFRDIGVLLKNKNIDFVIFGNLEPLNESKENKLEYIARSPYIISEILYRMIRGFETSGVYPVIKIDSKSNKNVIDSLLSKSGSFLSYSSEISDADFIKENAKITFLKNYDLKLKWNLTNNNFDNNIVKIYKNSIVLSGFRKDQNILLYREINYSNDRAVTFFSESVRSLAEEVLNGTEQPTGNKNW
ncbi:MAG: hypothetical protein ACQESN_05030 [Thermotogota bacterium]